MARRTHLNLEPLEGRALLSGLTYSLATNQSAYQPGQPVEMTFTETNVSSQPVMVQDGPSIDGFTVTQDGAVVWRSNAGMNPLFIKMDNLQPGQSLTMKATWDGIPTGGSAPLSGQFVISNQLNPQAATATVTISKSTSPPSNPTGQAPPTSPLPPPKDPTGTGSAPVSSQPVTAPVPVKIGTPSPTPQGPVTTPTAATPVQSSSPIAVSVTTNHPTYRRGHPVRITVTLQNVSNSSVALPLNGHVDEFTVLEGSTQVWHSARIVSGVGSLTIKPGQSIKFKAVWNGRPGQAGVAIAPGIYTIQAIDGGYSSSTTFRIVV